MTQTRRFLAVAILVIFVAVTACGGSDEETAVADTMIAPDTTTTTTTTTSPDAAAAATTTSPETESDPALATAATAPPPIAADVLSGSLLAPDGQRTTWKGVIDDSIEFTMWLAQQGDYLHGELTYSTSSQPIRVLGRAYAEGDSYYLHEFGEDGRVSGTLTLGAVSNGEVTNANWGDRELSLRFDGIASEPYFFDPLVRSGMYTYDFGPYGEEDELCCGATGQLQISAVTSTSLLIEIENVTSGPRFSLAIVERTEIPLVNNVARYDATDAEIGLDCAFDVTVFDGFAFIDHVEDRFTCLFGNGAGVLGMYLRTGEVIEPADSPFADATLTNTTFGDVALGDTWRSLTERFDVAPYDESDDFFGGECYYVNIGNDSLTPWFMMLGDGDDAVVSRIEPVLDSQRTDSGLGVGDTEADVEAVYGEAIVEDPHQYLGEGAKYLRVAPEDGTTSTLLFETDENGVITAIRNGFLDPIRWVEGCA